MTPPLKAQSIEVSLTYPPVDNNRGTLSRTAGGAQRGVANSSCIQGNTPLTVLAPSNNVITTVSGNPTLFLYVPQTTAKSAQFVVSDAKGNEVYLTSLALTGTPGVVQLSLPSTVSLETGQNYRWGFLLTCNLENGSDLPENAFVLGDLKRTDLTSEQKTKLAQAKEPLKQAEVYAEARIWQETLTILAQLRQNRPDDSNISKAWEELLDSVGLDAIATAPLVKCCTASSSGS